LILRVGLADILRPRRAAREWRVACQYAGRADHAEPRIVGLGAATLATEPERFRTVAALSRLEREPTIQDERRQHVRSSKDAPRLQREIAAGTLALPQQRDH